MWPIIYRRLGKISWRSVICREWLFFSIFVVLEIKPRHMPEVKVGCWSPILWLEAEATAYCLSNQEIWHLLPTSSALLSGSLWTHSRMTLQTTVLASVCVCRAGCQNESRVDLKAGHELGVGNSFPLHGSRKAPCPTCILLLISEHFVCRV